MNGLLPGRGAREVNGLLPPRLGDGADCGELAGADEGAERDGAGASKVALGAVDAPGPAVGVAVTVGCATSAEPTCAASEAGACASVVAGGTVVLGAGVVDLAVAVFLAGAACLALGAGAGFGVKSG